MASGRKKPPSTQLLLARNLVRLTMLPGGQEVGQRLAVGLGRQLAQGRVSMLQSLALGPKRGIAQTRAPFILGRTVAKATAAILAT